MATRSLCQRQAAHCIACSRQQFAIRHAHRPRTTRSARRRHQKQRHTPGQSFQATTEGFVAPNLSFVFEDSDTGSGVYPRSGAGVVMKGGNTREHFYAFSACFAAHYSGLSLADGSYLDYQPKIVIPISNCASTSDFTYAVTVSPPNSLATSNGQAAPTTRSTLQSSDDFGHAIYFRSGFFILPDCSSCITAGSPRIAAVKRRNAETQ